MAQNTINEARGLRSFKNELTLPAGALITADNVVIDRDNVIEPRRGFKLYGSFGEVTDLAKQVLQYKNTLMVHFDDSLLYDTGNGVFDTFDGSYSEMRQGLRIKGIETNGNYYFTTANGIKKISAKSSSEFTESAGFITDAGAPKALNASGSANLGTPGFLETQSAVAYRVLWGYKDANEVLILGAPSEYFIVRNLNVSSTAVVDITFTIPEEIIDNEDWFYQIYRSPIVDDSTTPGTAIPEDELNLVMEEFPTPTDFSNGYVEIQDITPDDFRNGGAALYTNPISGAGILQANERPPLAHDITSYKGYTFYANTKTRHQATLSLISTSLLAENDTVVFTQGLSVSTLTFKSVENIALGHVYLATGGSPSQNIDDTTRSLVRVLNRNVGPVYAYYISGPDDVPGQMLIESRTIADVEFSMKVGVGVNGGAFNPSLPTDNSEVSSNSEIPNRIFYSKQNQPEAVPIVNYFDVGEKDQEIQRIVALRDSLFILKGDGIFRLSGNNAANFVVTLSDSSATITAPDSATVLNNQIFMVSTQGVVSIPESGQPYVVSRDIEDLILRPKSFTNFSKATFGIGYESDRAYLLFIPTINSDTVATQCYRYNVFTQAWTRYMSEVEKTCGLVLRGQDKIYLGAGDVNYIEMERKNFDQAGTAKYDRTDYADREYDNSIPSNSVNGTRIILSTLSNVNVADTVYQETYITITRFNRLLRKLDNDFELDDSDYLDTLEMSAGDAMNNKLALLVAKISADDTIGSYTTPSGSNDFTVLRNEFNTLIDELNASAGTFYKTYTKYTDLVTYESIILTVNKFDNSVTITNEMPFIQGVVKIYSAIISSIEWAPNTLGDASLMKHFREATLMFDQYNFTIGNMEFRTDIADAFEGIEFLGEGNGAYGTQVYGEYVFGGEANQRPFRTYVPRNKQRCRFIIVKFTHKGSREKYAVTGYSVTYKQGVSERAYKR